VSTEVVNGISRSPYPNGDNRPEDLAEATYGLLRSTPILATPCGYTSGGAGGRAGAGLAVAR
jgi:hypothetical protein